MNANAQAQRLVTKARECYQRGQLGQAEGLCRQALAVHRGVVDALNLLGAIAQRSGRVDTAIEWLQKAVQADPRNPHCHNNLGVYLTHAERLTEAVACYKQALRLKSDFAEAYNNLTFAHYGLGQFEEARINGEKALRIRPDFAQANNHLGLALKELGRGEEAAERFRKAIRLQPQLAAAHRNLGGVVHELGRDAEAIACYEQALRLEPNFPEVHNDLADIFREQGRFEEGIAHLKQALRLKPDYALVYWNLSEYANQGLFSFTDEELQRVRSVLQSNRPSLLDRSVLHLTLGNVYDRRHSYDDAIFHYHQGNACRKEWLKMTGKGFDPAAHRVLIEKTIATFDEAFFDGEQLCGSQSEQPVFVVGMPRSGTTLVQQILASHSQAAGAGELWDITDIANSLGCTKGNSGYPARVRSLSGPELNRLANLYLQRLSRVSSQAARVVDKMPQNFLYLGLIARLFPRARVIHCRRDPLDVCLSCYIQNFSRVNFAWSFEDLGLYHQEYERLMSHWKRVLRLPVMEVRYEDLVARQEGVSRELVDFCGLPWEDSCLAFHKAKRSVKTASAVQVRRPMYSSSIGRGQGYGAHLDPLRRALGQVAGGVTQVSDVDPARLAPPEKWQESPQPHSANSR